MPCIFCNKNVEYGIELSDGNIIHNSCYNREYNRFKELDEQIAKLNIDLCYNKRMAEAQVSFLTNVIDFFTGYGDRYKKIDDAKNKVIKIENEIKKIKYEIYIIKQKIDYVHDYMLQYPPDWEERCNLLKQQGYDRRGRLRYYGYCSRCGASKFVQVHHIVPLSKGGSNKVSNLILLCRKCHLLEHNKNDFGSNKIKRLSLQKKIEIINYAITNKRKLIFLYKKKTDQVPIKRIITPYELVQIPHISHPGEFTLCIRGYCYLRNAERKFALKRMTNLEVENIS